MNQPACQLSSIFVVEIPGWNKPLWGNPDDPAITGLVSAGLSLKNAQLVHLAKLRHELLEAVYVTPEYRWAWDGKKDFRLWIAPDNDDGVFSLEFHNGEEAAQFASEFCAD